MAGAFFTPVSPLLPEAPVSPFPLEFPALCKFQIPAAQFFTAAFDNNGVNGCCFGLKYLNQASSVFFRDNTTSCFQVCLAGQNLSQELSC